MKPLGQLKRSTVDSRGRVLPTNFEELRQYLFGVFQPGRKIREDLELALNSVRDTMQSAAQEDAEYKVREQIKTLGAVVEVKILENELLGKRQHIDTKVNLANWDGYKLGAINYILQDQNARFLSFVVLDLVGFGKIDNTFGLAPGDSILKIVAQALSGIVRDRRRMQTSAGVVPLVYDEHHQRSIELTDMTARYGGDEFLYLLRGLRPQSLGIALRAKKTLKAIDWFSEPEVSGQRELQEYLTRYPLDFRGGAVDFLLPPMSVRPTRNQASEIVDWCFNRADVFMRVHKKDPENPIHYVSVEWQDDRLVEVSEVARAVL